MLPTHSSSQRSPAPLLNEPLASRRERYRQYLADRGYAVATITMYLGALDHFLHWLEQQGIATHSVTAEGIVAFLDDHLPHCCCPATGIQRDRKMVRAAMHQWLKMLGQPLRPRAWPAAITDQVAAYDAYLSDLAGLAPATRLYRRRYAGEFLLDQFGGTPLRYERLTPEGIRAYIAQRAKGLRPASAAVMVGSLRSFLRFIQVGGHAPANIAGALTAAAVWNRGTTVAGLDEAIVQSLLASFDRTTTTGKRDYAMGRCLVDLGLRTSEVAQLQLDDLDWYRGILTLAAGKSRQARGLPLPPTTGEAIAEYLRAGRPDTASRALFVHHRSLSGSSIDAATVRSAIRRGFSRAGVAPSLSQLHRLRRRTATRLLEARVSFKTIADLLGHQHYDTTRGYLAIDQRRLQEVAMPWPGSES